LRTLTICFMLASCLPSLWKHCQLMLICMPVSVLLNPQLKLRNVSLRVWMGTTPFHCFFSK
jgi:hypothetical protein